LSVADWSLVVAAVAIVFFMLGRASRRFSYRHTAQKTANIQPDKRSPNAASSSVGEKDQVCGIALLLNHDERTALGDLLKAGKTAQAAKLVREATGASRKQVKAFIVRRGDDLRDC